MSDSLATYLQDHLAGAAYAIDVVEFMRDKHKDQEMGQFASTLLVERSPLTATPCGKSLNARV